MINNRKTSPTKGSYCAFSNS